MKCYLPKVELSLDYKRRSHRRNRDQSVLPANQYDSYFPTRELLKVVDPELTIENTMRDKRGWCAFPF